MTPLKEMLIDSYLQALGEFSLSSMRGRIKSQDVTRIPAVKVEMEQLFNFFSDKVKRIKTSQTTEKRRGRIK